MSTTPFTHAFNFFSAVQGGVDPRTGLFMFNFPLGQVCGNNTLGPVLSLALSYSPLQAGNAFELGKGMSLGLTSYDRTTRLLALSSGERFRTDDAGGAAIPVIRQQKLDTVRIASGGNTLILTLKSGERQVLSEQGGNIYLPVSIESPLGYQLKLTWEAGTASRKLMAITDVQGATVCRFTYGTGIVDVVLWPDTTEAVSLRLELFNAYLTKITNTSVSPALVWTLDYESDPQLQIDGQAPLRRIASPTMLTERVIYKAGVMQFNTGTARGALPAVIHHEQVPGFGQPIQTTTFDYSTHNYLGFGETFAAFHPDDDNLYNRLTSYDYHSIETRRGDGTDAVPDCTIERHYNNYHLLVSETERQSGSRLTTRRETLYYAEVGRPFSDQPVTFQLPKTQTVSWDDGNGKTRTETTRFEYDAFGNLTKQTAPDGTVTTCAYYPAQNATPDCPAEPDGFTRLIKSRTVIPFRDGTYDDAPTLGTSWTYQKFDVRQGGTRPYAILQQQAIHSADSTKLSTEKFAYTGSPGSDEHGRMTSRTVIVHNGGADYSSTQNFIFRRNQSRLEQQLTTTADAEPGNPQNTGKLTVTTSRTQSALTGHLLDETDALGNRVAYRYDALGRLTSRKVHPDNPAYMAEETWSYTLPAADPATPAQVVHTDINGNRTRTHHDGLGRVIRAEMQDRDGNLGWQTVQAHDYDALGRNARSTSTDVVRTLQGQGVQSPLTYRVARKWDAWGQLREQAGLEDCVGEHHQADPVALTTTSWRTGAGDMATAKEKVFLDQRRCPIRIIQLAWDAQGHDWDPETRPYSTVAQAWDGARQLRKVTDEKSNVTGYRYDVYGRVTETTLPDGSIIRRQYAPFSGSALVTQISLQAPGAQAPLVLGSQKFDGLGRLVETRSGGRTSRFTYESDASQQPAEVALPGAVTQSYTTDVRLGEAPTAITASGPGSAVSQRFTYDRHTAQMLGATENGSCVSSWAPYPSGRLQTETQNILSGGQQQASHVYTLGGALQQSTRVDASVQTREYSTSAASIGQLVKISEPGVTVDLKYDALQRLLAWKATDRDGHTLTTTLELDSFGREVKRTLAHGGGDTRTVAQEWDVNHQLRSRTLARNGRTQCVETFAYDGRNRLVTYTASGEQLPVDAYGNAYVAQTFVFDPLGNITECRTTLKTGESNTAHYLFRNNDDPCQLSAVSNSLTGSGYPAQIQLAYDAGGRLIRDEAARTLTYDALGRLSGVDGREGKGGYGYDAADRMAWQRVDQESAVHRLYYQGARLVNEWVSTVGQPQDAARDGLVRLVHAVGNSAAAQVDSEAGTSSVMLTGTDAKHSVMSGSSGTVTQEYRYTPYGYRAPVPASKGRGLPGNVAGVKSFHFHFRDNTGNVATIYRNGRNQVAVLVRAVLLDAGQKVVKLSPQALAASLSLVDKATGRPVPYRRGEAPWGLVWSDGAGDFAGAAGYSSDANFGTPAQGAPNDNEAITLVCYLSCAGDVPAWQISAELLLEGGQKIAPQAAAPVSGVQWLTVRTLAPIDYSQPGDWEITGATHDKPPLLMSKPLSAPTDFPQQWWGSEMLAPRQITAAIAGYQIRHKQRPVFHTIRNIGKKVPSRVPGEADTLFRLAGDCSTVTSYHGGTKNAPTLCLSAWCPVELDRPLPGSLSVGFDKDFTAAVRRSSGTPALTPLRLLTSVARAVSPSDSCVSLYAATLELQWPDTEPDPGADPEKYQSGWADVINPSLFEITDVHGNRGVLRVDYTAPYHTENGDRPSRPYLGNAVTDDAGKVKYIPDFHLEYSDSPHTTAAIFGNGWNQAPVLVSMRLTDKDEQVVKLAPQELLQYISLYRKNGTKIERLALDDQRKTLSWQDTPGDFAKVVEFRGVSAAGKKADDDWSSVEVYLSSAEPGGNYEIYAAVSFPNASYSSRDDKHLMLQTLPAINYSLPENWRIEKQEPSSWQTFTAGEDTDDADWELGFRAQEYRFQWLQSTTEFVRVHGTGATYDGHNIGDRTNVFHVAQPTSAIYSGTQDWELIIYSWCLFESEGPFGDAVGYLCTDNFSSIWTLVGWSDKKYHGMRMQESHCIHHKPTQPASYFSIYRTDLKHANPVYCSSTFENDEVNNESVVEVTDVYGNHGVVIVHYTPDSWDPVFPPKSGTK